MVTQTVQLARNGRWSVEKKYGLTPAEFKRDHLDPGVPVVFGDATRDWPASTTFTPEFFRRRFGERELYVDVVDQTFHLSELLDRFEANDPLRPAPYPCKAVIARHFPELLKDVLPRYEYAQPDRSTSRLLPRRLLAGGSVLELFFGGPGGQFPYLHYDYMGLHAFINQMYGDKEFTVIPPHQTACVYADPANPWKSLIDNHHQPDLARYPLFANATPLTFVVGPGETLFIPNGWWHTARSLTVTISVAFDVLNGSNWARFEGEVANMLRDSRPWKRMAASVYLSAAGGLLGLAESLGLMI